MKSEQRHFEKQGRSAERMGAGAILLLAMLLALSVGSGAWAAEPGRGESAAVNGKTSKVERATVFLNGAELTRHMRVEVKPGKNVVLFGDLPADVLAESVTAKVSEGAQMISAAYRLNHLANPSGLEHVNKLNEELRQVKDDMARNAGEISVLDAEADFLKENRSIAGDGGIRLEELREIAQYYRTRLTEIANGKIALQRQREELQQRHDRLVQELGGAVDDGTKAVGEIQVELAAERAQTIDLVVSYYVRSAGWVPFYEIRVADMEGPAQLIGKGTIYQRTGENWDDIPIVLSSNQPTFGGVQPELQPWYLDLNVPQVHSRAQAYNEVIATEELMMQDAGGMQSYPRDMKSLKKPIAQQAQTSIEFVLPAPISVASQEEGHVVEIMNAELPAVYRHFAVRKLDRDVYVLAEIEGWEKLNLLAGQVRVFLANSYVGMTNLDPRRADETMKISLGRDSGVIVTRVKGRDFESKSLLGKNSKVTREWVLTVRNTRQTPIDIRVLDQIPVSVNKNITVEAVEISGAEHDTAKGELCWDLQLKPGESVQKTVKYLVTYPTGASVALE